MKKIKLLMPIVGITAISGVVLPLVGCSCGRPVVDINLDKTTATVDVDATFTIKATLKYKSNANTITWTQSSTDGGALTLSKRTSSDNEEITVTGKTKGNVTLKASCGGKEKTCAVVVNEVSTQVEFDYTDVDSEKHTCSVKVKTEPSALSTVNVPESTIIGDETYTVNAIAESGFEGKRNIKEVVLPNTIVEIKSAAFASSPHLTTIRLNEGLQAIQKMAFYACGQLDGVVLPSTLTTLGDEGTFSLCYSLKNFTFTKSLITKIPQQCFNNTLLTNGLTIPDNITTIGMWAFSGCKYDELIIDSPTIRDMDDGYFTSEIFDPPKKYILKEILSLLLLVLLLRSLLKQNQINLVI